jgi:hypothetical protein
MSRDAVSWEHACQRGVFRRGEPALESVEQPIEDRALAIIELRLAMGLPKLRLGQHASQNDVRGGERAV